MGYRHVANSHMNHLQSVLRDSCLQPGSVVRRGGGYVPSDKPIVTGVVIVFLQFKSTARFQRHSRSLSWNRNCRAGLAPTTGVIGGWCMSGDQSWISILYYPDCQVETTTGRVQQLFYFGSAIVLFVVVLGVGQTAENCIGLGPISTQLPGIYISGLESKIGSTEQKFPCDSGMYVSIRN